MKQCDTPTIERSWDGVERDMLGFGVVWCVMSILPATSVMRFTLITTFVRSPRMNDKTVDSYLTCIYTHGHGRLVCPGMSIKRSRYLANDIGLEI